MKRVLVCGSREWPANDLIWLTLDQLDSEFNGIEVIAGGARGADTDAACWAGFIGAQFREFKADWDTYGKAAGPMRNQQMIDEGKPDLIVAFIVDPKNSPGTQDMIRRAKRFGIAVRVFNLPEIEDEIIASTPTLF